MRILQLKRWSDQELSREARLDASLDYLRRVLREARDGAQRQQPDNRRDHRAEPAASVLRPPFSED